MLGQTGVARVQQLGFSFKSLLAGSYIGVGSHCDHDLLGFTLPSIVLLTVLGAYVGLLLWSSAGRPVERVFVAGYVLTMADTTIFTLVIPDSYSLVTKLGGEPYLSGLVIGVFKLGTFLGALLIFVLLRQRPNVWKDSSRPCFLVCGLCSLIGSAAWLLGAWLAGGTSPVGATALLALLMSGRVVSGIGAGFRLGLVRTQINCLNAVNIRPARQASILFAIQLGMGLGPLIAGSARLVDNQLCPAIANDRFETVGLTGVVLSLACLFVIVKLIPLDDVQEFSLAESRSVPASSNDSIAQTAFQVIVISCLGFSMLRTFVVSGGEVATSMLLEAEYRWQVAWIGIAVGACFLMCIPLSTFYSKYSTSLSVKSWIKLMLAVSMVGCMFYFEAPTKVLGHFNQDTRKLVEAWSLLFADLLVLPGFWLSDALSQGVMMNHVKQDGISLFSSSNMHIIQVLLLDGLSRTLGPALARGQANEEGRNGYAFQQTSLTAVAALLALLVILPRVHANGAPLVQGDEEDLKVSAK